MTIMSPKEIQDQIRQIEEMSARISAGMDPELAKRVVDAVEDRVLTEQPATSPLEGYERLLSRIGSDVASGQ